MTNNAKTPPQHIEGGMWHGCECQLCRFARAMEENKA